MNREIKFRAWDKKDKKIFDVEVFDLNCGDVSKVCILRDEKRTKKNYWYAPKEVVLMQYTGLKDKNGKEIYEGDIVIQEIWNGADNIDGESVTDEFEGIIIYDRNGYGIQTEICDGKRTEVPIYEIDEFVTTEIIGNIYENKNLIK